ncbi:DeoR family transcriptional regulator, partial [Salmonella enterica]|uniref:DeoR family transcriptional regulator n=1 Tax=Salmonella enterica TaxID=28901 RepID=UPI000AE607C9
SMWLVVSSQSVRRDSGKLSEMWLITRLHGGACGASSVVHNTLEQREFSLTHEKKDIADAIAVYIPDVSTICITIGTTIEQV